MAQAYKLAWDNDHWVANWDDNGNPRTVRLDVVDATYQDEAPAHAAAHAYFHGVQSPETDTPKAAPESTGPKASYPKDEA